MKFLSFAVTVSTRFAWGVWGCALLLLSGCASLSGPVGAPPDRDALNAFVLEGRFSLRQAERNYSGRLAWRHVGAENEVLLSSPFGQGLAEIVTDARGARLTTSDGKVFSAGDSEALTREVLGYPLPLARLADWLRARSSATGVAERDAQGRVRQLRDAEWLIDYEYDSDAASAPPGRIVAIHAGRGEVLELRLRIDSWAVLPPNTRLNYGSEP